MGKLRCKPGPVAAKSAANLPAPDIVLQIFLWHAPAMDKNYDRPVSRDYLLFTGEIALRKASRLWQKKRVPGDHNRLRPVAKAIVKHLELCGMHCFSRARGARP